MPKRIIFLLLPLILFTFIQNAHSAVKIKVSYRKYTYKELIKIEREYGGKHKALVIRNILIAHKDTNGKHPVLPVPIDPVGSFHGKLYFFVVKTGIS